MEEWGGGGRWIGVCLDGSLDGWVVAVWLDEQLAGWMDSWINGWTDLFQTVTHNIGLPSLV